MEPSDFAARDTRTQERESVERGEETPSPDEYHGTTLTNSRPLWVGNF